MAKQQLRYLDATTDEGSKRLDFRFQYGVLKVETVFAVWSSRDDEWIMNLDFDGFSFSFFLLPNFPRSINFEALNRRA